jgi:hypothetical protein
LFPEVRVVLLEDFENRILVTGRQLPAPRELSATLRRMLHQLGSKQAGRCAVRSVPA